MATLYVDIHIGIRVIDALQQGRALDLSVEPFSMHGPDDLDPEHMLRAAQNGWTILTRDTGFLRLHDLWYVTNLWRPTTPRMQHAGVCCVMSNAIQDPVVAAAVLALFASGRSMTDQLFTLEGPPQAPTWRQYRPFARRPRPVVET
jgi:hypothetical protein